MTDSRLLKCFEPVPLPVPRGDQTYQPADGSWFELKFRYRLEVPCTGGLLSQDNWNRFSALKGFMQEQVDLWGEYREDWFAKVANQTNYFYFMDSDKAALWRKIGPMTLDAKFQWQSDPSADLRETYVVVRGPSGEKIADSVLWCNERLGTSDEATWGYCPYGLSLRDIMFYFTEAVDPDTILLFKLTFGGQ